MLVVEDGTGKAEAESYISADDATAYHVARGNAAWGELAEEMKEACLRRATDYMAVYRERWAGYRLTATQALDWPRFEVPMRDAAALTYYPADVVPVPVQRACAELALRAIDGDLNADIEPPVIEETVGPITTKYADGAPQTKTYPAIDALLAPFLVGGTGSVKVTRA